MWTRCSGFGSVVKLGVFEGTATIASKVSVIDTLRTRIGYAQDNWLFYGTVGVALTNDSSSFTQTVGFACNTGVVACSSKSDWHAGLAAGAGVYAANLCLSGANALAGAVLRIGIDFAATLNSTIPSPERILRASFALSEAPEAFRAAHKDAGQGRSLTLTHPEFDGDVFARRDPR